jgi:hypothetical protein
MTVPKVQDLDRVVSRYAVMSRLVDFSHTKFAENLTSAWSFLTLAGPRFAVRNSIEDLMVHLAVGDGAWGVVAGKRLSTKIRLGQGGETLSVINKLVNKKSRTEFAGKVAEAKTVEDARKIMAEAVMRDKFLGKIDPQAREIIAEMAEFGQIDDMLAAVAEGGKKGITGSDNWNDALRTVDKYGISREYKIDGVTYAKDQGGTYREYSPVTTEGKIAWITSIAAVGNDELGSIALRFIENPEYAKKEIVKLLGSPQYAKERAGFQLYSNGADEAEHARRVPVAIHSHRAPPAETARLGASLMG